MAAANFKLVAPKTAQNVEVKLGADFTVPCDLSPRVSAVDMEIRWFKETDCVCLYKNRVVTEGMGYGNRVSLLQEELNRGNVSLRLQKFNLSDFGDYLCQVTSGDRTEEITVRVEKGNSSLYMRIAAGALAVGLLAIPGVGLAATAFGAAGALAAGGAAVTAAASGGAVAGVTAAEVAEITVMIVNRKWSEQERQKMERSDLLTELYKHSKHIEETDRYLVEREEKIKDLEMDKMTLLDEKDKLQRTIQCKDKMLEEKDKLLQTTNEKLSQTTREMEEKQKQIVEKNTQLDNMNKLISEKERELQKTVKEMEASKFQLATLTIELQENVRQLQDEVERILKKPSSHSLQVRRSSKGRIGPNMSGETSNQVSSALISGSELRLVLLGSAGCEKTAAGNVIMNIEKMEAGDIQQSESRQGEVDGKQVTVVETPDWFCSELSLEEVRQDVRRCIRLSAPGPHAFLLVIPVHQSTGVEREMMEKMEETFGEKCWKNSIIIFTVTKEEQKKNIGEFVQSGNQEIQRLLEKCENRFHCLNIHQTGDSSQISELLEKIEKMMEGNTERFNSSEIYLETERLVAEKEEFNKTQEEEIRQILDREVQKVLCKFKAVIGKLEDHTELEK